MTEPPRGGEPGAESEMSVASDNSKSGLKELWGTIVIIVEAILLALVVRTFLFQPFNIPSGSMEDTLLIGDYLFVSKYAYGYSRYSFPFDVPFSGRIWAGEPERGDVVVFRPPNDTSTDFIKRVIGLPGDTIQMRNGQLFINDVAVPKERIDDYMEVQDDGRVVAVPRYRETLPNGVSYEVLDRIPNASVDNTRVFEVPPGHYFMMGDNRDASNDSRLDVGYVPAENLVGRAEIIFFSVNKDSQNEPAIWEFWKKPWGIRFDRFFRWI
jgi:signal peptidase I